MKFPRIRPYKTFLVDDDGKRTRLDAHEIVLERPIGVDLEINLAPHFRFRGRVSFSTFRGSCLVLEPESGGGLTSLPRTAHAATADERRTDVASAHPSAMSTLWTRAARRPPSPRAHSPSRWAGPWS
jgi:hypothetical protein